MLWEIPMQAQPGRGPYNRGTMMGSAVRFRRRLLEWYGCEKRNLPWRTVPGRLPDPYRVLVSEVMLQQTTVATVIPYFQRFVERFPTIDALASADERQVLRLWQGLGYYSRARNLLRAAQQVVSRHRGLIPCGLDALLELPGVGRYTAGAIASLAFGVRAPVLDGNVARVLCRIDAIEADPRAPRTREALWQRAEQLVPQRRPGEFNSAMMELGATVCTPQAPRCAVCPVSGHCQAAASGLQDRIPPPRSRRPRPLLERNVLCISRGSRWLIEQRPATGRWARLWQFITLPAEGGAPTAAAIRSRLSLRTSTPRLIGTTEHILTHRRYWFDVYRCAAQAGGGGPTASQAGDRRKWVTMREMDGYPLPVPHIAVAQILRQ
jgi:A/G-specific adenine glycosylase